MTASNLLTGRGLFVIPSTLAVSSSDRGHQQFGGNSIQRHQILRTASAAHFHAARAKPADLSSLYTCPLAIDAKAASYGNGQWCGSTSARWRSTRSRSCTRQFRHTSRVPRETSSCSIPNRQYVVVSVRGDALICTPGITHMPTRLDSPPSSPKSALETSLAPNRMSCSGPDSFQSVPLMFYSAAA